MPRSIPALVKPALLLGAERGLKLEQVAQKLKLETDLLRSWESGEERPTIPQVRRLGEIYKRPLAVFFLPEQPHGFRAMKYG